MRREYVPAVAMAVPVRDREGGTGRVVQGVVQGVAVGILRLW
jgi:hypothetical protein